MKIARHLSATMLGLFVVATWASADPLSLTPSNNPYTQSDADGVPVVIAQPQSKLEFEMLRKEQERAVQNKNWLLRGYEERARANASNSPGNQEMNLYYQLSTNQELAKLAGLPMLDSSSQASMTPYRTGSASYDQGSATSSSPSASSYAPQNNLFKPLITPLSMGAYSSAYLAPPTSMVSQFTSILPQPSRLSSMDQFQESSDIETPGLVAAKKDPLTDIKTSDLEVLPGETIEQARAHQDNMSLELPAPMDVAQMHKAEAASLTVPSAPKTPQPPTVAPVSTVPAEDPNAPLPVGKIPPINPIRSPVANPYDILDR